MKSRRAKTPNKAERSGNAIGPGGMPGPISLEVRQAGSSPRLSRGVVDIVPAEPDITLKELATALSETERVQVKLSSLHRALGRTLDRAPGHRRGHERSGIRH